MISSKIENSIIKYISRSATSEDLDILTEWIKTPSNKQIFKDYVKAHYMITYSINDPNPDTIIAQLHKEIKKQKRTSYTSKLKSFYKYAAILILFFGLGYFYQKIFVKTKPDHILVTKVKDITLQLGDGTITTISDIGEGKITDATGNVLGEQNGSKLIYIDKALSQELSYHTIKVPYGKRFSIILSDQTQVFLNSGSSIKYPVPFIKGKNREVFLNGEAFFDVAEDKTHPFIVNANELDIKVLGTKFNVTNYPEDDQTEVVLVEGSVHLNIEGNYSETKKGMVLKPGYKGTFDKTEKTISDTKVNTEIYTSWKTGNIIFRNAPFENIIKKLERHYNVTIINNNNKLDHETFNANIGIDEESIEDVLYYFNKVYQIHYKIENNKIIIN
ncbi:FecR family protein [Aquimarina longa]|uniref:FecR family protein n=1 Tax=Aquimarina longa TaxID=1080221 RepID=UPI000782D9A2|nr:FecR family protein [Aquimarina longa]